MTPYVVLLCAGAKRLSSVLELGEEMRQGLDLFPAFALAYRLDAEIAEKAIEDGGPFFRQGRTAIVLFLPDRSPVASKAGSFEGTGQRRTERTETGEFGARQPRRKIVHQLLPRDRRDEIERHTPSSTIARVRLGFGPERDIVTPSTQSRMAPRSWDKRRTVVPGTQFRGQIISGHAAGHKNLRERGAFLGTSSVRVTRNVPCGVPAGPLARAVFQSPLSGCPSRCAVGSRQGAPPDPALPSNLP